MENDKITAPPEGRSAQHVQHEHQAHKPGLMDQVRKHPLMVDAIVILLILGLAGGFIYLQDSQSKILIEKAQIYAPTISLGPQAPGQIEKFYVDEGDEVSQGQKLAVVGGQVIEAKTQGIIIWTMNAPGQYVTPATPVVKMVDPRQMRVVGRLQEDKGLKDVHQGEKVMFSVDAFGNKQYEGVIDSVAMSARENDIVFSISDKRETREFEVRALFDIKAYPEIKNGMSAKMWVYK